MSCTITANSNGWAGCTSSSAVVVIRGLVHRCRCYPVTGRPRDVDRVRARGSGSLSTQRERLAAVWTAHLHVPAPAKTDTRVLRGGGHEWPSGEAARVVAALPSAG